MRAATLAARALASTDSLSQSKSLTGSNSALAVFGATPTRTCSGLSLREAPSKSLSGSFGLANLNGMMNKRKSLGNSSLGGSSGGSSRHRLFGMASSKNSSHLDDRTFLNIIGSDMVSEEHIAAQVNRIEKNSSITQVEMEDSLFLTENHRRTLPHLKCVVSQLD